MDIEMRWHPFCHLDCSDSHGPYIGLAIIRGFLGKGREGGRRR